MPSPGFLFRAQPSLMTLDRSATIMDAIFASPDEESRGRLLRIMQEFLVSEAAKHSTKEKESAKGKSKNVDVNMEELVGNTDGFADSGVSSAIVQRYLGPILEAALSQNVQIQAVAIDVLSFTIKQGLAHPLQSFPVIVALETSASTGLSSRANSLHAILHSKHTSLLNTRYIVSAKASFDYQKKLCAGPVQGYRMQPIPTALLQRWYSLVREKRASRQDFLKALVKVFDVNSALKSSQDDLDFTRYMAENFSAFDYKTQEEVFTVIKYLTSVLSTTGMQLVEILAPSNLLTQLHGSKDVLPTEPDGMSATLNGSPPVPKPQPLENVEVARSSVIISMTMLLKAHLKSLYGLSEEKCSKFVAGKKSAVGDKTAVKRQEKPISWSRLPSATAPLFTSEDVNVQKSRFLEIWNEDGLTAEPEDDLA
jgi:cohesin loading factor subunit SCC2